MSHRRRRRRSVVVVEFVVLVLTAATVLAGCGDEAGGSAPDPEVAAAATASAIDLLVIGCRVEPVHGAGALVSDAAGNTWVLTAAHVVAGASSIVITTADRSAHALNAALVALDPVNDLALLRSPLTEPSLGLAQVPASPGDRGAAVVFDDRVASALVYEIVSRASVNIDDIHHETRNKRSGYRVDIDIELGDSGAVLVDADGRAAGVLYAKSLTSDGSAFATDTSAIVTLLDAAADVGDGATLDTGECAVP